MLDGVRSVAYSHLAVDICFAAALEGGGMDETNKGNRNSTV